MRSSLQAQTRVDLHETLLILLSAASSSVSLRARLARSHLLLILGSALPHHRSQFQTNSSDSVLLCLCLQMKDFYRACNAVQRLLAEENPGKGRRLGGYSPGGALTQRATAERDDGHFSLMQSRPDTSCGGAADSGVLTKQNRSGFGPQECSAPSGAALAAVDRLSARLTSGEFLSLTD